MTGYGSDRKENESYELQLEISSVNRKYNEVQARCQKEYSFLEQEIRSFFKEKSIRGAITVSVIVSEKKAEELSSCDMEYFVKEIEVLKSISHAVQCAAPLESGVLELWKNRAQLKNEQKAGEGLKELLSQALREAFIQFMDSKEKEGLFIQKEFINQLLFLRQLEASVRERVKDQTIHIKERLEKLLEAFVPSLAPDERLLREVVLYADKADVSEELSRIDHHLAQFEKTAMKEGPIGKTLEFILQELLREWNTLGAKTSVAEVSSNVVFAKTELEKMREQVQNVE